MIMTARSGPLHHALNTRLSERQYRHIVAQATLAEVPLSEALRQALDRDIEAQPDLQGDVTMSYSALLDGVELEAALRQLREAGLA
jgi:hypothetical protein